MAEEKKEIDSIVFERNIVMSKEKFKSGFCSIVGMANVGKSTLLNKIAGQKIAIISDKPQTTRNKILAIHTTNEEQIIFTDTRLPSQSFIISAR